MGWGKILGLAALGVGAVAAAPFTGGGSILGAATLAGSLAGAGAVAAGAGAVGAGVGYAISRKDEEEEKAKEEKIANFNQKSQKAESALKEHEKHTNLILALSALGCAMANADGEISPDELIELNEFVGGLSSQSYPTHIVNQINEFISNPPTFSEAVKHLKKVNSVEYHEIRNLLVMIMESDGIIHTREQSFLRAFDIEIDRLSK
jgi:tellurite resistance protein